MRYYTIYCITNRLNGKFYIGMHSTENLEDGYMGSGQLIKHAIRKYGVHNFEKEIWLLCESEHEMKQMEALIVSDNFLNTHKDTCYNLLSGGKGGWDYIARTRTKDEWKRIAALGGGSPNNKGFKGKTHNEATRQKISCKLKGNKSWSGKCHTSETKRKMSKSKNKGRKNSQFGTVWITNGKENKKHRNSNQLPEGWSFGRKMKC